GLQALRLLAAGAVFTLHCLFWSANWIKPAVDFVFPYFGLGVQLFYTVSAFALMHSTRIYEREPTWARQFYIKRFFRIAPLYYVMIPLTIVHRLVRGEAGVPPASEIATNFLFVNNLWPDYVLGIPMAGWSVSVEVLFYLIFPLVFIYIRSIRAALILVAG